jgi:hypothetical protein
MTVKFTNNSSTTVATAINTTATSLVVASAAGFPALSGSGDYCYLTIQQAAGTNVEVVKATALSSNTFTIVRAQDGTSAGSWSVSDVVELRVTAALLTDIVDAATHDSSVLSVDSTNNRVGVNDTTPSVTLDINGTDAIALPVGTTAQRPAAGAGRFRYNSSLSQFEGYTDAWGAIGGGGTNTFTTDTFTANGSLVAFNLSQTVASANNLLCFIDGVFQTQDAYAIATASGTTTLTFSAAPANGRKIVVYSVAAGISGTNLNVDSMTGDGSDVTLTLTINTIKENTQVFIDGVYQAKANYSISGTTLTFSTAPPNGSAVECVTMTQTEINVPVDGTITSAKLSGALTTPAALTVTGALAANGGAVFNEGGADVDFRVESDINANGLVLLGDTGHVGINGSPTAYALEVFDTDGNGIAYKDTTNSVTSFMGAYQSVAITGTLTNHSYALWTNNTERMRINSDGALALGTSSTYNMRATIAGAGAAVSTGTGSYALLSLYDTSTAGIGKGGGIAFQGEDGTNSAVTFAAINGSKENAGTGNYASYLGFSTRANGGNLTEKMRIDASGNLLVGRTVALNSSHNFYKNQANSTAIFENAHAVTPFGVQLRFSGADPNNQTSYMFAGYGYNGSSLIPRFAVMSNGGIRNYQTNNVDLSDERVKTDIQPLGSMWDKLKAIEIVGFKYTDQTHERSNIGVIAQQVQSVAPEFVDDSSWDDERFDEPLKSVFSNDLHNATIKALQEAMDRIETLEAKVQTLENN